MVRLLAVLCPCTGTKRPYCLLYLGSASISDHIPGFFDEILNAIVGTTINVLSSISIVSHQIMALVYSFSQIKESLCDRDVK